MLQTDYSNLFAAGLRVIESRSSSYRSSSVSSSPTPDHQDVTALNRTPRGRRFISQPDYGLARPHGVKRTQPRILARTPQIVSCPGPRGGVQCPVVSWRKPHWTYGYGTGCVDPYLHKIDSGSPSSNRKAIIVTLPNSPSLEEHGIPTSQTRLRDRRVSVQTVPVHMMTTHPSRPSLDKRAVWDDESTSNSSSSDGRSGMDNDWRQFRVEWIDFEGDP
ncbi:hypothetical protein BGW80DRAFT_864091 [Lactifluus volemus]|nr:hypothetical protein BGW80DRAFT_864091 [Lactifluus volemus]